MPVATIDLSVATRQADPALLRLPAPGLRGTWARAYALLTRLVSQIGWDELLKTRSSVFVMEEEYRMQKAHADSQIHSPSKIIHEDGTVTSPKRGASLQGQAAADDDASTRGMVSPSASTPDHAGQAEKPEGEPESEADTATLASTNGLPTIRISTESAREQKAAAAAAANGHEEASANEAKENGVKERVGDALKKPVQAAENPEGEGGQAPSQEPFSFSNKRLCERWLDNLFMVLYEVRVAATPYHYVHGPEIEYFAIGSARLDNLPCGGRALQDAACCVPQDRAGVGDPGRPWHPPAPQRGGKGGVPALSRHAALLFKAVVEAIRHVRGRRRHPADAPGRSPSGGIPVGRVCGDDSTCSESPSLLAINDLQTLCAIVPHPDRPLFLQAGPDPWTR